MTMKRNDVREALAAHADQLNTADSQAAHALERLGDQDPDLENLFRLADRVKFALKPVYPSEDYKRKLLSDLSEVARQHMRRDILLGPPKPRAELIIGAAVALVGGIAYLIHSYSRATREVGSSGQRAHPA
jgi:hypothetical protein